MKIRQETSFLDTDVVNRHSPDAGCSSVKIPVSALLSKVDRAQRAPWSAEAVGSRASWCSKPLLSRRQDTRALVRFCTARPDASCRCRSHSQWGDERQDVEEDLPRHRALGHRRMTGRLWRTTFAPIFTTLSRRLVSGKCQDQAPHPAAMAVAPRRAPVSLDPVLDPCEDRR